MIMVCSQKGGVGKTTVAVNLAVALGMLNYKVLLIDADFMAPTVGFFLGIDDANIGISDVMEKKVALKKATIRHDVSGIDVLPGTLSPKELPSEPAMESFLKGISSIKDYDFVIVDTPPGTMHHEVAEMVNEVLLVSIPTMASVSNSIKLSDIYDKEKVQHNIIINRMQNRRYELTQGEIDDAIGIKSIIYLPEDSKVPLSEAQHIPLYIMDQKAPFCLNFSLLVRFYAAKKGSLMDRQAKIKQGRIASFIRIFRRILGI